MVTATELCLPAYPFGTQQGYDLDSEYSQLQQCSGLGRVQMPYGGTAWLAVRDEDVRFVLCDPRFSREIANEADRPRLTPRQLPPGSVSALDGPSHARVRRLVAGAFSGREVRRFAERVRAVTHDLVDDIEATGQATDLVSEICHPVPLRMICHLLGIPDSDRPEFEHLLADLRSWQRPEADLDTSRSQLELYIFGLIEQRRQRHHTDLLARLVAIHDEGGPLSNDELVNLGVALLAGGVGTPAAFLSGALYLLLADHSRWRRLLAYREQIGPASEELLRYVPIGTSGGKMRVATADVEIGGTLVRAGEAIIPVMISADRDPTRYDRPDEIDLDRCPSGHLAFGYGAHRCLGAELARMEVKEALDVLLDRLPNLRLATDPNEVPWLTNLVVRGPRQLLASW